MRRDAVCLECRWQSVIFPLDGHKLHTARSGSGSGSGSPRPALRCPRCTLEGFLQLASSTFPFFFGRPGARGKQRSGAEELERRQRRELGHRPTPTTGSGLQGLLAWDGSHAPAADQGPRSDLGRVALAHAQKQGVEVRRAGLRTHIRYDSSCCRHDAGARPIACCMGIASHASTEWGWGPAAWRHVLCLQPSPPTRATNGRPRQDRHLRRGEAGP